MTDNMTLSGDNSALSLRGGVEALQAKRATAETQTELELETNKNNEISEAGRTLAKARTSKPSEPATEEEAESEVETEVEAEAETEEEIEQEADSEGQEEELPEDETEQEELEVEAPEEPKGLLTLDDGTTLTIDEAKNGYLRNRDYTQKTQKLAQQRKELEAEAKARLQTLDLAISASKPEPEPNWRQRAKANPTNWQLEKLDYDERTRSRNNAVAILKQEQNNIIEKTKESAVHDLQSGVYRTDWKNGNTFANDIDATNNFAQKHLGFSPEELGGIGDPRAIIALDMARRFAENKTKVQTAKKKVVNKPRPLKGSSKQSLKAGKTKVVSSAQKAFNSNPSRANGLELMRAMRTAKK